MSLFAIIGFDAEGSDKKREDLVQPHCAALTKLKDQVRLFAAGPLKATPVQDSPYRGSVLIIDFENQEQAEQWFANEPYNKAGVYKDISIFPYIDAMSIL